MHAKILYCECHLSELGTLHPNGLSTFGPNVLSTFGPNVLSMLSTIVHQGRVIASVRVRASVTPSSVQLAWPLLSKIANDKIKMASIEKTIKTEKDIFV